MREQPTATTTPKSGAVPTSDDTVSAAIVSVDEIIARYPGQWILMQVTSDEGGWPSHGQLLARADTYDEIARARIALLPDVNLADGPLYVFDAYPPIRTGEELRVVLENIRDETSDPFRWPRV